MGLSSDRAQRETSDLHMSLDYPSTHSLMAHRQGLETSLVTLDRELEGLGEHANKFRQALLDAKRSASKLGDHMSKVWSLVPVNRRPTTFGEEAGKVFDTPELAEHILSFLAWEDLIRATAINKACRNTMEGSLKLKQILNISPQKSNDFYYSPFSPTHDDCEFFCRIQFHENDLPQDKDLPRKDDDFPTIYYHENVNTWGLRNTIDIKASFGSMRPFPDLRLGSRYRVMRLCNHSPETVAITNPCPGCDSAPEIRFNIDPSNGFPVDDLFELSVNYLWFTEVNCPYCGYEDKSGDRVEQQKVMFEWSVPIREDDPFLKAYYKHGYATGPY